MNHLIAANSLSTGSRRNFIVRLKCGTYEGDFEETDARLLEIKNRCKEKRISYKDESYSVVHCTGYIRVRVVIFWWFVVGKKVVSSEIFRFLLKNTR